RVVTGRIVLPVARDDLVEGLATGIGDVREKIRQHGKAVDRPIVLRWRDGGLQQDFFHLPSFLRLRSGRRSTSASLRRARRIERWGGWCAGSAWWRDDWASCHNIRRARRSGTNANGPTLR